MARTYTKTKYSNIEAQGYDDVLGQADSIEEFIDDRMMVGTPQECVLYGKDFVGHSSVLTSVERRSGISA
jgi:hypothetical protein